MHASLVSAALAFGFLVIISLSVGTEMERGGKAPGVFPWILEGTAFCGVLLALPVALMGGFLFPLEPERFWPAIPVHIGLALIFAAVQILVMLGLRSALWPVIFADGYQYGDDPLGIAIYEGRKQVAVYAGVQLVVAVARRLSQLGEEARAARHDARRDHMITLRCGGRELRLPAGEIIAVSAAGNYVEVRTVSGVHLARATLSGLEAMLTEAGADPVRVHRSHLAARSAIREIVPKADGDGQARLADGSVLPVSRRHRAQV